MARAAAGRVALSLILIFMASGESRGGWISEVQPEARQVFDASHTSLVMLPPLIELSGMAGLGGVELVILDASASATRVGSILQTILIPDGPGTRLVAAGDWPGRVFPFGGGVGGQVTELTSGVSLDLGGPRTVMLFDEPTGLVAGSGRFQDYVADVGLLAVLDVVTFNGGPKRPGWAFGDESVLNRSVGEVLARVGSGGGDGVPVFVSGVPDEHGFLLGVNPEYQLSPGRQNTVWQEDNPEPGAGAALLVMFVWLSGVAGRDWVRACCPN